MTHTPTPWVARDEYIYSQDRIEIGTTTTSGFYHGTDDANAAHIVKCVNMHDELVEVLDSVLEGIKLGYNLGYLENEVEEALKKAGAL